MKNNINFMVNREDSSIVINLSKYKNDKYILLIHLEKPSEKFSRSHKQTFGQKKFDLLYRNLNDLINKKDIDDMGLDLLNNKDITIWHDLNKWSEPVLSVVDVTEDRKDLVLFVLYIEDLKALYDYFSFVQNNLSSEKYEEMIEEQYFDINSSHFDLKISKKEEQDFVFANAIATVDGVEPSRDAQRIMKLYSRGEIDYETAQFEVERIYKNE